MSDVTLTQLFEDAQASRNRGLPRLYEVPKNDMLCKRETEVLLQVVEGLSNKQIAEKLFISEKTVKNHLYRTFVKFDVQSRTELVVKAFRTGLVT